MNHALSIYKLNLPFIEHKYDRAIFYELCGDFEKLMKYREIFQKVVHKELEGIIYKTLCFTGGKCEFIFHKSDLYYIPKYQIEIFFEDPVDPELIRRIINIFTSFNLRNYIFDSSEEIKKHLENKNIISVVILEESFRFFGARKLEIFLRGTQRKYISETLKNTPQIRNSFYYLIYLSYISYQNQLQTERELGNLEELQIKTDNRVYEGALEMSSKRLEYVHNISLVHFKKYREVLESFFEILKNT